MGNQALGMVMALIGVAFTICAALLCADARHRFRLLENLFNNAPAAALLDHDFKVRQVNPAFTRLFGHSPEEAKGQPIDVLVLSAGSRSSLESHAAGLARGEAFDAENSLSRKGVAPFSGSSTYIPARVGRKRMLLAVYRETAPDRSTDSLANSSRRIIEMQEFERLRLARELHDDFGQSLTGLRMLLRTRADEMAPEPLKGRIEQARLVVEELISGVRSMAFDLRPADLDQLGLVPALTALFDRFTARTELLVHFDHELPERRLSPSLETAAYRIVQEALTNAARHSGATSVNVRLRMESARLRVEVEDRGAGFDLTAAETPQSNGLSGMHERAYLLGGHMRVDSSPGCGTTIRVELPVEVA